MEIGDSRSILHITEGEYGLLVGYNKILNFNEMISYLCVGNDGQWQRPCPCTLGYHSGIAHPVLGCCAFSVAGDRKSMEFGMVCAVAAA